MAKQTRNKRDPAGGKETATIAVERAYELIKERSINFGFRPGKRINELELASSLEMSRPTVREALNRLVMSNLVLFEPGKGFFGRKFSVTELSELFTVRTDLELVSIRESCKSASDEAIAALRQQLEETAKNQAGLEMKDVLALDEHFHIELASLAGNAERITMLRNINERIRFVRRINLETRLGRHECISEHIGITVAVADRDVAKAAELLRHHLGLNTRAIKNSLQQGLARIYVDDVI